MVAISTRDKKLTTLHVAGMRDAVAALDACLETVTDSALLPGQYEYIERAIVKARGRLMDELYAAERELIALPPPADA